MNRNILLKQVLHKSRSLQPLHQFLQRETISLSFQLQKLLPWRNRCLPVTPSEDLNLRILLLNFVVPLLKRGKTSHASRSHEATFKGSRQAVAVRCALYNCRFCGWQLSKVECDGKRCSIPYVGIPRYADKSRAKKSTLAKVP
ncbi:hypothetical protein P8452_13815 [Trifolium repens]|nr:hypothetical protein P8452_13815 [Trifolium repens]